MPVKQRKLNDAWVDAGKRRIIARALRQYGLTYQQIADMLEVSITTAKKDAPSTQIFADELTPEPSARTLNA